MPIDNKLYQEARHLRLRKRFGQNFLVDAGVLDRIVQTLDLSEQDQVLEIGPGAGFLTERLLARTKHLVSVELERSMVAYLSSKFRDHDNLTLMSQDILRFDFQAAIDQGRLTVPFKVVGNIPYNITSSIVFYLCGEVDQPDYPLRRQISTITLMVQKEVAERLAAKPGTKAYNHLSIAVQMWFEPTLVFTVPAGAFYPAPKVESAVVTFKPRLQPKADIRDHAVFAQLIRHAFSQRRKILRNSLLGSRFASAAVLDRMFALVATTHPELGIQPDHRAEALSIEAFGALANAYIDAQNACQD